jgi:hypothetical protein
LSRVTVLARLLLGFGPMLVQSLTLLAWLAADDPIPAVPSIPPSPTVRSGRPTAIWFEPQLRFHSFGTGRADLFGSDMSLLPLGLEIGRQLGRRALVSLTAAWLPISDGSQELIAATGRLYARDQSCTPYLGVALGLVRQNGEVTSETNPFAMAGPGYEATLPNGVSLSADVLVGPEKRADDDDKTWASSWHLSAFTRVGVGYRF